MARVAHVSSLLPYSTDRDGRETGCMRIPDMGQRQRRGRFIRAARSFLSMSVFPRRLSNDSTAREMNERTGSRIVIATAQPIFHPRRAAMERTRKARVFAKLPCARNFSPTRTRMRREFRNAARIDAAVINYSLVFMFMKFMFLSSLQIILFCVCHYD